MRGRAAPTRSSGGTRFRGIRPRARGRSGVLNSQQRGRTLMRSIAAVGGSADDDEVATVAKPSSSRFQLITRCLAYCTPDGAAILRLAEIDHQQTLETRQFEREIAELYQEYGWTYPDRLSDS